MRKVCAVLGAVFGVVYTIIGMKGGYNNPDLAAPPVWRAVLEFCVLVFFVSGFFFALGMGFGLLLEGVAKLFRRKKS